MSTTTAPTASAPPAVITATTVAAASTISTFSDRPALALAPLTAEKAANALPYVAVLRADVDATAAAAAAAAGTTGTADVRGAAGPVPLGTDGLGRHALPNPSTKKAATAGSDHSFSFPPQQPPPREPPGALTYPSFCTTHSKVDKGNEGNGRRRAILLGTLVALVVIVCCAIATGSVLGLKLGTRSGGADAASSTTSVSTSLPRFDSSSYSTALSRTSTGASPQSTSLAAQFTPATSQPGASLSGINQTTTSSLLLSSGSALIAGPTTVAYNNTSSKSPSTTTPPPPSTSTHILPPPPTPRRASSVSPTPSANPIPPLFQILVVDLGSVIGCLGPRPNSTGLHIRLCEAPAQRDGTQVYAGEQGAAWVHGATGLCLAVLPKSTGGPGLLPCTGLLEQTWTLRGLTLYNGNGTCATSPDAISTIVIPCANFTLMAV
ncbi:hypothetical protein DFJ73DRAFT_767813 [Zopfochytrium polystomum]|nr:hypothetical protein DFJ73DRAFT_767813 [Zopfochytrium polystomum]